MKRWFSLFLILILLCAICVGFFACEEAAAPIAEDDGVTDVLFLGDSITEGIAGVSPLTEREAYAFYGIVGNCNEFSYYNRGVSGYTTQNLLDFVQREDDGIHRLKSLIAGADVIYISIIGNDFLKANRTKIMRELSRDDYTTVHALQESATKNIEEILAILRSLNPKAQILMQNLYNPSESDSPLFLDHIQTHLSANGIEPDGYHAFMDRIVREINKVLTDYLDTHTTTDKKGVKHPPFELVDIYPAFESIHDEDLPRWNRLFCGDGIHPSDEGHALIAGVLQEKLTEMGYASPDALAHYKESKIAQLERLFGENDLSLLSASIAGADSFDAVTKAYFDGTEGLIPAYPESNDTPRGKVFEETQRFEISLASVFGFDLKPFLTDNSYIEFASDGSYTLYLKLSNLASEAIKAYIDQSGGIDVGRYFSMKLILPYISDIAPEIENTDVEGLFRSLQSWLGFEIKGIDFNKESVRKVLARFAEKQELVIDDPDIVGRFSLKCTGNYRLETVTSKLTGEEYTAIYVNNAAGKTESYVRYTYTEDPFGEKKVRMIIDVARIELEGISDVAEE